MGVDEPPAYASIFGELAAKKATSDGVVDFTKEAAGVMDKKASGVAGKICCGIFCGLIGMALPVAEIVIGALYLNDCPAQYLLPIYLIVSGVFGLLSGSSSGGQRFSRNKDDDEEEESGKAKFMKCVGCFGNCVGMFVFAWFICGNVWTFQMQECDSSVTLMANSTNLPCFTKDAAYSASDVYCKQLLYDFTFWAIIVKWIMYGILILVGLIGCICCCVAFCCAGKKAGGDMAMKADDNV